MWYIHYDRVLRKYESAKREVEQNKDRQEELFQITQPKAIRTDYERGNIAKDGRIFEEYLIAAEREGIAEKRKAAEEIAGDYLVLLKYLEGALCESRNPKDRIYKRKVIDKSSIEIIARMEGLSVSQVYRNLQEIMGNCKRDHI